MGVIAKKPETHVSFSHNLFESLLLLVWLAIFYAFVRTLAFRVNRAKWGVDVLAGVSVALFLFGSAWHPTTRIERAATVPTASLPQQPAAAADASHQVKCTSGARAAGSAIGHIDALTVNATQQVTSREIVLRSDDVVNVGGWLAVKNAPALNACIVVDGKVAATAGVYGGSRPDVAVALGRPALANTAFGLSTTKLRRGTHTISVAAVDGAAVMAIGQQITISVR